MTTFRTMGAGLAAALLVCAAAGRARGQGATPTLRVGQTVRGQLLGSDPALSDRGRFKIYEMHLQERVRYQATLQSDAFEGYLMLGQRLRGVTDYPLTAETGGERPRSTTLTFIPRRSETFVLIVQSVREEGTGPFTLTLQTAPEPRRPASTSLQAGETRGVFTAADARHPDEPDRYVDHYSFSGQPGQRFRIGARAAAGPLRVEVGVERAGAFRVLARAPASGEMNFTQPGRNIYIVRVTSPPGGAGEYTVILRDRASLPEGASRP